MRTSGTFRLSFLLPHHTNFRTVSITHSEQQTHFLAISIHVSDIAAKEEFAKHFKAFIEQLLCRDGLCLRPLSLEEFCRKTEACAIALRASEANHASVIAAGKATLAALNSLIVKSSIDAYNQLRDSDRARRRNIRNFERMTTIAGITLAAGVLVYTIYHIL